MRLKLTIAALLVAFGAHAQQYPSPTFNSVTINSQLNGNSLPSSMLCGISDTQTLTNKSISSSQITGLGTAATATIGTSGATIPLLSTANTWTLAQTLSTPLAITSGGTGSNTAPLARTALGLGTAAVANTGTSGAVVPLLNGINTWGAAQTFGTVTITGGTITGITDIAVADGGTGASTAPQARINLGVAGGNLPATATNDNATAGNLGEFISLETTSGTAVTLTSGSPANVTSISLTAGDWDVWGDVVFTPGGITTVSAIISVINTTSATIPAPPAGGSYSQLTSSLSIGATQVLGVGMRRISIASTTTVYLVAQSTFALGANSAYGGIYARRAR